MVRRSRGARRGTRRQSGPRREMIKNAVASLMVRLHHLPLAAPTPTYRRHHHHHALRLLRPASASARPVAAAAMSTAAEQAVADQKRALRTEVRKALKALSPDQRASEGQEELAKDLYVPRVEDKNRNMRMLRITTMDDLVKNSMNILEPSPVDASGNDREDVALSYSVQIMDEGVIPVNSTDVHIDALVTSSGVIPISPAALERMQ
nr:unnamed protein product [Digitaria exilis]